MTKPIQLDQLYFNSWQDIRVEGQQLACEPSWKNGWIKTYFYFKNQTLHVETISQVWRCVDAFFKFGWYNHLDKKALWEGFKDKNIVVRTEECPEKASFRKVVGEKLSSYSNPTSCKVDLCFSLADFKNTVGWVNKVAQEPLKLIKNFLNEIGPVPGGTLKKDLEELGFPLDQLDTELWKEKLIYEATFNQWDTQAVVERIREICSTFKYSFSVQTNASTVDVSVPLENFYFYKGHYCFNHNGHHYSIEDLDEEIDGMLRPMVQVQESLPYIAVLRKELDAHKLALKKAQEAKTPEMIALEKDGKELEQSLQRLPLDIRTKYEKMMEQVPLDFALKNLSYEATCILFDTAKGPEKGGVSFVLKNSLGAYINQTATKEEREQWDTLRPYLLLGVRDWLVPCPIDIILDESEFQMVTSRLIDKSAPEENSRRGGVIVDPLKKWVILFFYIKDCDGRLESYEYTRFSYRLPEEFSYSDVRVDLFKELNQVNVVIKKRPHPYKRKEISEDAFGPIGRRRKIRLNP